MSPARKGKIARLPAPIREEVNRRLLDGQPASQILPWLNSQAAVLRVLEAFFAGEPITPQNLSEWRQGGYRDWLARRERLTHLKELAGYAAQLGAAAGGSLTDGSAAIIGGKILEALENATAEDITGLTKALVALRASDLEARRADQRDRLLAQRERAVALAEQQFQVKTCEAFLQWFENKRAREIAESQSASEVKIDELRRLMFGDRDEFTPTALNE
ncbi:MAG: hypothetical protein D6781_10660 [Verrucomicrobia bacterium]|nr:MAG: hypothetical protein D6781_10660 [Verrucomicrobiota bacterium]